MVHISCRAIVAEVLRDSIGYIGYFYMGEDFNMCLSLQMVTSSFCTLYSSGIWGEWYPLNTDTTEVNNLGYVEGYIGCSVTAQIIPESQGKHGAWCWSGRQLWLLHQGTAGQWECCAAAVCFLRAGDCINNAVQGQYKSARRGMLLQHLKNFFSLLAFCFLQSNYSFDFQVGAGKTRKCRAGVCNSVFPLLEGAGVVSQA